MTGHSKGQYKTHLKDISQDLRMEIKEFDFVLLKKEKNLKIEQVIMKRQVWMCKMKFSIDAAIGQQFGSAFRIENGEIIKLDYNIHLDDTDIDKAMPEKDNRNLVDNTCNQRLSKDEIHSLHKQGISGDEIVDQLVENSATFNQKTEYSQQKYLKKKRKKHVAVLYVLKPNTRNLLEFYYSRGPTKICNLRMDSLAQILTQANIQSGCRAMVVETCSGLIIGSCLERMAGMGSLIHMYTGTAPNRPAITEGYKFSRDFTKILHDYPLNQVVKLKKHQSVSALLSKSGEQTVYNTKEIHTDSVNIEADNSFFNSDENKEHDGLCVMSQSRQGSVELRDMSPDVIVQSSHDNQHDNKSDVDKRNLMKRKLDKEREHKQLIRREQIDYAKSIIETGSMDCLIVAARFHPTPVVLSLIDFVAPSRPIVVFSPYKEPLIDCFMKLREHGSILMIKLSEAWLRQYQVLSERTHPSINMSGGGGYMLTAITVQADTKSSSS